MIFFTKYANEKFEILKRHGINVDKREVEETINAPDLIDESKAPLIFARKSVSNKHLKVVYKKEVGIVKIITFYPVYEKAK